MSKREKLLSKLANSQARMTWPELVTLLRALGYRLVEGDGSRVKFEHDARAPINLHRPHPGNVSIHARDRATTTFGRGYAPPERDYPPEGGGFQPESVFDEIKAYVRRLVLEHLNEEGI